MHLLFVLSSGSLFQQSYTFPFVTHGARMSTPGIAVWYVALHGIDIWHHSDLSVPCIISYNIRTEMQNLGHCPISTVTTHIGSSCACSGGQSCFWSRFDKWFGQSKAVPVRYPQPTIPLFRAIVTAMAKWLYIQPMAIYSPNYSPAFIEYNSGTCQSVLHNALYRRC